MSERAIPKTFGEEFVSGIDDCQTKGVLFSLLCEAALKHYPQHDLHEYVHKISDFNSVAAYQAKLAKIRIDYNANAVRNIQDRLVALPDKSDNKEKMIRKLNLLLQNHPTLDDMIYMSAATYIAKDYGAAEHFKAELKDYLRETKV